MRVSLRRFPRFRKHRIDNSTVMEESPLWQGRHAAALLELGIAILIGVGAGYLAVEMPTFVEVGGIQETQDFVRLSPVFFPRLSFGLTSLISIVLVFRMLKSMPGRRTFRFSMSADQTRRVFTMSILVVVYCVLLPFFGYGFATLLAVAATTYFLGMRSWLPLLVFSFLTPVVTRFIFERLLAISLPLSRYEPLAALEQELMRLLAGIFL
jgi:Tripartite tricarboxylate transporter TctB family